MAADDPGDPIHAAQLSPRRVHRVRLLGLGAGILSTYLQRWSVHVDCNELERAVTGEVLAEEPEGPGEDNDRVGQGTAIRFQTGSKPLADAERKKSKRVVEYCGPSSTSCCTSVRDA